jgi:hypothetical protein
MAKKKSQTEGYFDVIRGMELPATSNESTKERMSAFIAVFNSHVNNADERARALMKEFFPEQLAEVEAMEVEGKKYADGIMTIFNLGVSPAIMLYVGLVTAFVNEDR